MIDNGPQDEALTDEEIEVAQGGEIGDGGDGTIHIRMDQDTGHEALEKSYQQEG